ncbi:hypothetical protein Snoj_57130 [Streptomyces nojiriensis]|uniref:Phytase-like domain-containing protein n=1 Tax=Streptomyces nojiriensis TaxID=66374 RepID=A0ABQ3SUH4_9ACTN|nr:esterase-like activity of phytase family protein [Streptomyces nojiriensis]QTI45335.1 hypothetical protein JYK04_03119 [Streptomyces nojiriensis]GGR95051.1 hypothetical protein GCM10010205_24660 [Streptomyces nojiriensis]GHI71795.1 hypothetical protein Snoj_57130 [Streptomyces nojiriensis]
MKGLAPPAVAAEAPERNRSCSPYLSVAGHSDALDKTTIDGRLVGGISGLAVDRDGTIAALSDKSALYSLKVGRGDIPKATATKRLSLTDGAGQPLDSEGIVVDRDGSYLVTDEFAPAIRRCGRTGGVLGTLPVPDAFRLAPQGRATANQTFESLTLLPGGRTLVAGVEGRWPVTARTRRAGPCSGSRPGSGTGTESSSSAGSTPTRWIPGTGWWSSRRRATVG